MAPTTSGDDMAARAEQLLQARLEPIRVLGKLLAEKADIDQRINEQNAICRKAGWSAKEIKELSEPPKAGKQQRRQQSSGILEDADPEPTGTHTGQSHDTGHGHE